MNLPSRLTFLNYEPPPLALPFSFTHLLSRLCFLNNTSPSSLHFSELQFSLSVNDAPHSPYFFSTMTLPPSQQHPSLLSKLQPLSSLPSMPTFLPMSMSLQPPASTPIIKI